MIIKTYSILTTDFEEFNNFVDNVFLGLTSKKLIVGNKLVYHFYDFGEMTNDIDTSPAIIIILPIKITEFLWRSGQIHIQKNGMTKINPDFHKVVKRLIENLDNNKNVIWNQGNFLGDGKFNYYLRGTLQNISWKIISLDSGMIHLDNQKYYLAPNDNESVVSKELKSLKLIGLF